ncbi:MAG: LysM peptidoglycan-binding domain-containing protein [Chitinophagaceae bacterium]|nr:LysM peptidoglycan-binding domain-containing protein [Chitinophagaceae bacterium]
MNRNRIFLVALLVLMIQVVMGQEELISHGVAPDLYVIHKVEAKETWFSLSRKYNLTPKEIATYNSKSLERALDVGSPIKIPLTAANFSQNDPTGSVDDLVPIYHIVQDREWMYRISVNHNKVPIEKLERWNNISRDQAKAGTKLIVGFLSGSKPAQQTASTSTTPAAKPVTPPQPTQPAATGGTATTSGSKEPGGYFKSLYDENGKNKTGVSGIFKSTSGWTDGKYYALMNNVTVGTIVKVSNPSNNRAIYAKVLGELPEMRESAGLALRISDAAAKELGAAANKFNVQVMY